MSLLNTPLCYVPLSLLTNTMLILTVEQYNEGVKMEFKFLLESYEKLKFELKFET